MSEEMRATARGTVASIVVNTVDPEKLSRFWAELLGLSVMSSYEGEFVWLSAVSPGGPKLAFQRVELPSEGPRRIHLDLHAEDPTELLSRAVGLGAEEFEQHTIGDFAWTVLKDPEGNEFCIAQG
ncbi:VOC family protein [Arthrobacter sp. NPDC090010]|uniref:VOC family protein n=1 Tax=Arthrobacter sp. NPDC090010 TaxID=3363942 RepID=UPI003810BC43